MKLKTIWLLFIVALISFPHQIIDAVSIINESNDYEDALSALEQIIDRIDDEQVDMNKRVKRDDGGVTNLDIRAAILQLLKVIRQGNNQFEKHENREKKLGENIIAKLGNVGSGFEKKIDNISTFLLRMSSKIDSIERQVKKRRGGGSSSVLETLASESFDILSMLPTYIENTQKSVSEMATESKANFDTLKSVLVGGPDDENGNQKSLTEVLKSTEKNILGASKELQEIVIESGHMAESLFERVNDGYIELTDEIKGLSNVEQVLLDTADSVMDTKRKLEFGVQQILFKVSELVKLSGGQMDENLKEQFEDVTKIILSNQNEALGNLTKKVEKEIGQVWRQMGIMYGQVSNSITILEKVKDATEGYVNKTGKNLGQMEGQVEGLTDSMVAVDSNMNHMLGQLSLVVQEFNQVKTGLSDAMAGLGDELEDIKKYEGNNSNGEN